MNRTGDAQSPYLVFMLALSFFALTLLAVSAIFQLSVSTLKIVEYTDHVICILFFIDFVLSLLKAPNRFEYFYTWGWLDLISSLPTVGFLRVGRAARIFRILRVLRGVRSTKILADFILRKRAEGTFIAVGIITILFVMIASIGILHFETTPESNIKSVEDALWWSVTTVTTVGYGDRFPVTTEGRILAAALMTAGVGLFGTFSGFVASWFLKAESSPNSEEVESLKAQLQQLSEKLKNYNESHRA